MKYKNKFRIETTRLKYWDYSSNGWYFITICVKNREYAFGKIINGDMVLSEIGRAADQCWRGIPGHFTFVKLDEFVIMPNHVHGIIVIDKPIDISTSPLPSPHTFGKFGPQSKNIPSIVRGFKIGVTKFAKNKGFPFLWQSRYYDHVIRDENSLNRIRNYIINNPLNWNEDDFYFNAESQEGARKSLD